MASSSGQGSGDQPGERRPPKNLQDVLKYAISHTTGEGDEGNKEPEEGGQESKAEVSINFYPSFNFTHPGE